MDAGDFSALLGAPLQAAEGDALASLSFDAEAPGAAPGVAPEDWRDWAGLPEHVLVKVAGKVISQTEAGWAAWFKNIITNWSQDLIQRKMAQRKRDGNCLFVFARVCKEWRKAQLKVGGRLRTRVKSDVILPGQVELLKWALAEGCPRREWDTMVNAALWYGHDELAKWLRGNGFSGCRSFVLSKWLLG